MSRERGLGGAQTKAPRGHSLRPLRATVPGFSVSGVGLDRAAILNQHALVTALRRFLLSWIKLAHPPDRAHTTVVSLLAVDVRRA